MSLMRFSVSFSLVTVLTLAGCGGISLPKIESDKIDYKAAQQLPPLEVPPDLSKPAADDRFAIPAAPAAGAATPGAAPPSVVVPATPAQATLLKGDDGSQSLALGDGFDRAWRRVGLALDRVGLAVEDRDRAKGVYHIRYADGDNKPQEDGFLTKWLGFGKKAPPAEKKYQILVKDKEGGSSVNVLDANGNPDLTETAGRIANLLYEQLK